MAFARKSSLNLLVKLKFFANTLNSSISTTLANPIAQFGIMLKEIDVIGKKIEIYKVKLLLFMAVASGSWVYALKFDGISYVIMLWFVFLTSIIGIFLNMTKLSNMEKKLEETR